MKINKLANKKEIKKIIEIGDDFILKNFSIFHKLKLEKLKIVLKF